MTDRTDRIFQYHQRFQLSKPNTDTSMLSEREIEVIKTAMNKEWTNPKFKMKWFVGNAQVTSFAQFRQFLMEIKAKEEAIEDLEYNVAKYDIEITRNERLIEESPDDLERKLAELDIWRLKRDKERTQRILQNWYLERQQFCDLLLEMSETDAVKLPDGSGRTYWDIIGTDEEDVYEKILWTNRLAKQAACDIMFYGRINTGNMDAILQMDPDQQAETFALATDFSIKIQTHLHQLQNNAEQTARLPGAPFDLKELKAPNIPLDDGPQPQIDNIIPSATPIMPGNDNDDKDLLNVYNV